jgi:hypothetical protein
VKKKVIIPLASVIVVGIIVIALIIVLLPPIQPPITTLSEWKAIIVCGANDFYDTETEDEYNNRNDATFLNGQGNWTFSGTNCAYFYDRELCIIQH